MPLAMKMSEAQKIQKAVETVREMMCSSDKNPFQEYYPYSLITKLFHSPSSTNVHPYSLPDAWGEMMNANRAHLVIMLREAGAEHDPFRNAEWSSTPAHVWGNLAKVEQLPNLEDADLSRIDFKWADLACAKLKGADLSAADLRWADLTAADLTGANLTGANLRGANLTGANLSCARLMDADLKGADLRRAIVNRTNLTNADLTRANVIGADLHSAFLDDYTKLDEAIGLD